MDGESGRSVGQMEARTCEIGNLLHENNTHTVCAMDTAPRAAGIHHLISVCPPCSCRHAPLVGG